ncbi:MAG TPA: EscU/YscU/HrcU family type III secretion system export apparatus switch protein, partial [Alphaproteobacteria bacterium]|nr:EscU/YscU/HrcU family type III secretion system export apparatus switch protein [Alphaproteobacteria bacterium]
MSDQDNEQKTEEPSARRLTKAFEEGEVPKSAEVSSWILLAAGTLVLGVAVGPMIESLKPDLTSFLARPETFVLDGTGGINFAITVSWILFKALVLPLGILVIA